MKATTWQRVRRIAKSYVLKSCVLKSYVLKSYVLQIAALFTASIVFAQCSTVLPEDGTQPAPPANYGALVSTALKGFKGFADYSNFQISGLRWVHAASGWSWLTCVSYTDHGLKRFYSFFINNNAVINARYDVRTDQCGAQQYVPFDVTTGTVGSPTALLQQPIY